jgi:acetolactate decarboxylase
MSSRREIQSHSCFRPRVSVGYSVGSRGKESQNTPGSDSRKALGIMSGNNFDNSSRSAFRRWVTAMWTHHELGGGQGGGEDRKDDDGQRSAVYQTSTLAALLDGIYDGDVTIAEVLRHGDFGLGTFNGLDGEMLILDGKCYHLRSDGSAQLAHDDQLTPFATVTHFHTDHSFDIDGTNTDRATLTALIDTELDSPNLIYAIRVTGHFDVVRTSTVMEQHHPYPPLTKAAGGQQESTFSDIDGTLAGFRMPSYEQGVAVAGYHLHFLDDTRRHGGHALDYVIDKGTVDISVRAEMHLSLPRTPQFLEANLAHTDVADEIQQTEGG